MAKTYSITKEWAAAISQFELALPNLPIDWNNYMLYGIACANSRNTHTIKFHCLTLQVIPVCLAIGTFIIVPQIGARVYGKINEAELTFNDLQSKQIVSTQKLGITPLNARRDVAVYLGQSELDKKLIKISSNSLYYVRELTHSVPYLVPEA